MKPTKNEIITTPDSAFLTHTVQMKLMLLMKEIPAFSELLNPHGSDETEMSKDDFHEWFATS